jgi:hypothetical protein
VAKAVSLRHAGHCQPLLHRYAGEILALDSPQYASPREAGGLFLMRAVWFSLLIVVLICGLASQLSAAPPFAEGFNTNAANWKFNATTDLSHVSSGGPDGSGYVSRTQAFSSASTTSQTLFRAHADFNSSNQLYTGNWLTAGVFEVTAMVRHNAPEPLNFRARFSSPFNFPGASALLPATVAPNAWTMVTFEIDPASEQYFQLGPDPMNDQFEGSTFNEIFADVGNIQIGVGIPASLRGGSSLYTFDLDQVRINVVPEPAAGLLLLASGVAALGIGRRRSR